MAKKTDGGPAFPVALSPYTSDPNVGESKHIPGMSLRDYFAAKAMQGILAGRASDPESWSDEKAETTARQAYERADAMLAARQS